MDNKITFMAGSILDNQATIKAIDIKIGSFLLVLLTPFSNINKIFAQFEKINNILPNWATNSLCIVFFIFWLLALLSFVRGLLAIDNPALHIINSAQSKGIFYSGGLYKFSFVDAFFNREVIKCSKDVTTFNNEFPEHREEIEKELAFELMKLIYIRETKNFRLKIGAKLSYIWLLIGIISFLISRFI